MKLKLCDEFFYRVKDKDCLFNFFDTCEENLNRNNSNIKIYNGEYLKIKINDYVIHFVKPMQTLHNIAQIYNTTEEEIELRNDLKSKKLFIGQKLIIPKEKPTNL